MAKKVVSPIWSEDGLTLTNALVDNKLKTYNVVTTWYDGTPMDSSKIDDDLVYISYEGQFLRENFIKEQDTFLEKDTVEQLRNLTTKEILLLKAKIYKGVKLNGYYVKGDTPAPIEYYLSDTSNNDDGGSIFEVSGIKLEHVFVTNINLKYFGYFGTGDALGYLIKLHNVANKQKLNVVVEGILNIESSGTIIVDTNSDYSNAILNVNLSVRNVNNPLFSISSKETTDINVIDISNTSFKNSIISRLKKGSINIPELSNYKDKLLVFEDSTTPDAIRLNSNGTEQSRSFLMDCAAVLDGGKLSTPIRQTFTNLTRIKYYNITDNIVFKAGIVNYFGNNTSDNYLASTYYFCRSNVDFIEAIVRDSNLTSVKNIFNQIKIDYSYNLRMFNIKGQAIKDNTGNSTYFLNVYMSCNTLLDNIVAENEDNSWGAIGSNYWKNVTILNSKLNRIDGHFGLYNLHVENTSIGFRGIRAIGGGYIKLINCTARCQDIINFREDYGSKWDGDITIENLNWQLLDTTSAQSIVRYTIFDYDFLTKKKFADSIRINNIKIDASFVTAGTPLVRAIEFGGTTSYDIDFPKEILVKDVYNISDTNCQFLVFQITQSANWVKYKLPTYIGGLFSPTTNRYRTNSNITIDNIIGNREIITLNIPYTTDGISNGSIVPKFTIKNSRVIADIGALKGEVYLDNCEIAKFNAYNLGYAQGIIKFNSCIIKPNGSTTVFDNHYNVPEQYTKFIGCTIYSPLNGNTSGVSNVNAFYNGIFNVNSYIKCTHIGTEMADDLKTYLSASNQFLQNLKLKIKEDSNTSLRPIISQAAASNDTATQAIGATPTKAEFDALLAELRDLKTKMRTATVLAT